MAGRRRRWSSWAGILLLVLGTAAASADDDAPTTEEAVVERILELQRQIDELLSQLPPELQEEVRRRLAERATAEPAAVDAETSGEEPQGSEPQGESAPTAEDETAMVSLPTPIVPAPPPVVQPPPPVVQPPPPVVQPPPPRRRRPTCNTLAVFDENQDGKISALDRYWRHLYLWRDRDGNGVLEESEVRSAYDLGAREIAVDLETFVDKKGRLREVRRERRLILDVRGDGFADGRGGDDAVLVIDAGAIQRGDGPRILDRSGAVLDGLQPFREGLQVRFDEGKPIVLDCP